MPGLLKKVILNFRVKIKASSNDTKLKLFQKKVNPKHSLDACLKAFVLIALIVLHYGEHCRAKNFLSFLNLKKPTILTD